MHLRITSLAAKDLEGIGDYIAQDNPLRAFSFIAELQAQCEKICLNPVGYRSRPELAEGLRSCAYGQYLIFFESTKMDVIVIRVLHSSRDIQQLFL